MIRVYNNKLDQWIAGLSSDTTHVVAISCHHDVAVHSPAFSPTEMEKKNVILFINCTLHTHRNFFTHTHTYEIYIYIYKKIILGMLGTSIVGIYTNKSDGKI